MRTYELQRPLTGDESDKYLIGNSIMKCPIQNTTVRSNDNDGKSFQISFLMIY